MLATEKENRISMLDILCNDWFLMTEEEIEESIAKKKAAFEAKTPKPSGGEDEEESKTLSLDKMTTAEERKERV